MDVLVPLQPNLSLKLEDLEFPDIQTVMNSPRLPQFLR